MPDETEVVVVGAGVAGCAAALRLAAAGVPSVLVDREAFPREKACGEGLMPHGLSELEALGVSVAGRRFLGIRYAVGDAVAEGRFPDGLTGLGVRRRDLDAALVEACRRSGRVDVRTGVSVRGIAGQPGKMEVATEGGVVRARAVVAADGLHSRARGWLRLAAPSGGRPRFGVRQHVALAPGQAAGKFVEVHVVPAAGVEVYLTPTGPGELNVAVLVERRELAGFGGDLGGAMAHWVAMVPAVAARLAGSRPVTEPLATGPLQQSVSAMSTDGAVLVGDAAGFLDAITGEGMSLGLIGARLAVDVLVEGLATNRLDAAFLSAYDARLRARSAEITRMTRVVLWGLRHRWLARHVVRNLGRHPDVFERVLAVNVDRAPLSSVGLGGVRKLVFGV